MPFYKRVIRKCNLAPRTVAFEAPQKKPSTPQTMPNITGQAEEKDTELMKDASAIVFDPEKTIWMKQFPTQDFLYE